MIFSIHHVCDKCTCMQIIFIISVYQRLYTFYLYDFIHISSLRLVTVRPLQQTNELQCTHFAAPLRGTFLFDEVFPEISILGITIFRQKDKGLVRSANAAGQVSVYACATMRRTPRLQQRNSKESVRLRHTSGRECPI